MKTKYEFEVREIDAIMDGDFWSWNTSYFLFDFSTAAKDEKRAFLRALKNRGIVFSVPVYVDFDGDIYEIRERKTDCPLFASIPKF